MRRGDTRTALAQKLKLLQAMKTPFEHNVYREDSLDGKIKMGGCEIRVAGPSHLAGEHTRHTVTTFTIYRYDELGAFVDRFPCKIEEPILPSPRDITDTQ